MHRLLRRTAVAFVSLSLLLSAAAPAHAAPTDRERMRRAVGFIASQQRNNGSIPAFSPIGSTADAVLAFVAAGTGRPSMRTALRYLARQAERGNVTGVGLQAKVALALAAAGRNPRNVGGENLIAQIRNAYSDGLSPIVFDTALAVLALRSANAAVPAAARNFLVNEQCPDGGWAYDAFNDGEDEHCFSGDAGSDFFRSDTNATALTIMALEAIDASPTTNPFAFLRSIRDGDRGGWGYTWGFTETDANSTALVLQAYAARGREAPQRAERALRSLQYKRCGAFAFGFSGEAPTAPDVGATIGAVPAIRGLAMPFSREVSGPAPATPDCQAG
ncbi:MAG TPA: hypothetical protein VLA82_11895 [Actinomycetota bacterium]|nr:hypothetical protein [Actinomycetota bacterium]